MCVQVFRYTRMLFTPVCSSVLCYCKKVIEGEKVNKPASDKGTYMYAQCNVLSGVKSFCSCYTLQRSNKVLLQQMPLLSMEGKHIHGVSLLSWI